LIEGRETGDISGVADVDHPERGYELADTDGDVLDSVSHHPALERVDPVDIADIVIDIADIADDVDDIVGYVPLTNCIADLVDDVAWPTADADVGRQALRPERFVIRYDSPLGSSSDPNPRVAF